MLEAIQFIFMGKKSDQTKIQVGETGAQVELELTENGVPVKVTTKIEKDGSPSWTMKMKGVKKSNPREILKRMFSFGTFNPREMLNPKDRLARLLQLIPLSLTQDDLIMSDGTQFPIQDINALDYDLHAYQVLKDLDKDLRNHRHSLFQKKDILSKANEKKLYDLESNIVAFKGKYDNQDPLEFKGTHVEHAVNLSEHNHKIDSLKESIRQGSESINKSRRALEKAKNELEHSGERIKKFKYDIENYNKLVKIAEEGIEQQRQELKKWETEKRHNEKEIENLNLDINKNREDIDKLNKSIQGQQSTLLIAQDAQVIKDKKKEIEKEKVDVDKAVGEWKTLDNIVKVEFKNFMSKVLKPIQEKVPGLSVVDGEFKLNGVSLDELSGSEVIKLGIQLMRLENKGSNLILINEAEALDAESIKDIDFKDDEQVLIARVADEPLKGDWNSVNMEITK